MQHKFNGILKEIIQQNPADLSVFLEDKLQVPPDKAEELALRIQKQLTQKTQSQEDTQTVLEKPDKTTPQKASIYKLDSLSGKEFAYFIRWFLGELGYSIEVETLNVDWGMDLVAEKEDEETVILARRYTSNYEVSEAILPLAQQAKQEYECKKAIIIATTMFSLQARACAQTLGVELWDPDTIDAQIKAVREKVDCEQNARFPQFTGNLMETLLKLDESKYFIVEPRASGKYDLHLPEVKFPLLTFQGQKDTVVQCMFRIKNNRPLPENEGEPLISTDDEGSRVGPDDAEAYEAIKEYLEDILE